MVFAMIPEAEATTAQSELIARYRYSLLYTRELLIETAQSELLLRRENDSHLRLTTIFQPPLTPQPHCPLPPSSLSHLLFHSPSGLWTSRSE